MQAERTATVAVDQSFLTDAREAARKKFAIGALPVSGVSHATLGRSPGSWPLAIGLSSPTSQSRLMKCSIHSDIHRFGVNKLLKSIRIGDDIINVRLEYSYARRSTSDRYPSLSRLPSHRLLIHYLSDLLQSIKNK